MIGVGVADEAQDGVLGGLDDPVGVEGRVVRVEPSDQWLEENRRQVTGGRRVALQQPTMDLSTRLGGWGRSIGWLDHAKVRDRALLVQDTCVMVMILPRA